MRLAEGITRALAAYKGPEEGPRRPSADDLGMFATMALLAVINAGAQAGFRQLRANSGYGRRLAPHLALRHRLLVTLLQGGVLTPLKTKRRLDDSLSEAAWEDAALEDADWSIVWDDAEQSRLPERLRAALDHYAETRPARGIFLETWQALATAECLAFGEYALASHNLNPAVARAAATAIQPVLAQQSIGQGCAIMWFSAKNLAAWFLRNGGNAPGSAERELVNSIHRHFNRSIFTSQPVTRFSRHSAVPLSTFASVFIHASRLGDDYWDVPISEEALQRARPSR